MVSGPQLAWIQRGRQPVGRVACLGDASGQVLEGLSSSAAGHLSELQRVIGAATDDTFRRHCTLGALRGGVLTVFVDSESLVMCLRVEWLLRLRELIAEQCRSFHVSDIRFAVGRSDLTVSGPAEEADRQILEGPE